MLWIFHLWGENLSKPQSVRLNFTCVLIHISQQMARIFGKYVLHCNGINTFDTLMGNFNWEPISRNDIVSMYGIAHLSAPSLSHKKLKPYNTFS